MVAMPFTQNTNPLHNYPKIRDGLYLAQWIINLILGAAGIALVTLGLNPVWFIVVTAVANFVWSYVGLTAKRNVVAYPQYDVNADVVEAAFEFEFKDDDAV